MKYKDIKQLAAAFASGELDRKEYELVLDNDDSFLQFVGKLPTGMKKNSPEADCYKDRKNNEAAELFRGRGYDDLQDACEAAGIPCTWC